jgi:hypothetical protein
VVSDIEHYGIGEVKCKLYLKELNFNFIRTLFLILTLFLLCFSRFHLLEVCVIVWCCCEGMGT